MRNINDIVYLFHEVNAFRVSQIWTSGNFVHYLCCQGKKERWVTSSGIRP